MRKASCSEESTVIIKFASDGTTVRPISAKPAASRRRPRAFSSSERCRNSLSASAATPAACAGVEGSNGSFTLSRLPGGQQLVGCPSASAGAGADVEGSLLEIPVIKQSVPPTEIDQLARPGPDSTTDKTRPARIQRRRHRASHSHRVPSQSWPGPGESATRWPHAMSDLITTPASTPPLPPYRGDRPHHDPPGGVATRCLDRMPLRNPGHLMFSAVLPLFVARCDGPGSPKR